MRSLPQAATWLAWCAVTVALVGCGSSGGSGVAQDPQLAAVAGTYVIDIERSIAAMPTSAITPSAASERDARLRTVFAADAFSLEIRTGGSFELTIHRGGATHTVSGTCTARETTVALTVTTFDGTALVEGERTTDAVARDGDSLVLSEGGRSIYLTHL